MSENMEPRDDFPRISIDSLSDWYRIKDNFNNAALSILDSKLAGQGMSDYRDLFLQYMKQV